MGKDPSIPCEDVACHCLYHLERAPFLYKARTSSNPQTKYPKDDHKASQELHWKHTSFSHSDKQQLRTTYFNNLTSLSQLPTLNYGPFKNSPPPKTKKNKKPNMPQQPPTAEGKISLNPLKLINCNIPPLSKFVSKPIDALANVR